ncbi:hypothetical protein [Pseudonocardia humida]|uniref:DUF3558 domain-containing protein n=1 Tax=Pseudonocardia humida TaxID=2800819 RepID=A0ABT1A8C9_9PSEU|nr:hypothetical protein [Pseudonocardia humida]MCO1659258.1 hypothetical protein [Pseudonocardia humida]
MGFDAVRGESWAVAVAVVLVAVGALAGCGWPPGSPAGGGLPEAGGAPAGTCERYATRQEVEVDLGVTVPDVHGEPADCVFELGHGEAVRISVDGDGLLGAGGGIDAPGAVAVTGLGDRAVFTPTTDGGAPLRPGAALRVQVGPGIVAVVLTHSTDAVSPVVGDVRARLTALAGRVLARL